MPGIKPAFRKDGDLVQTFRVQVSGIKADPAAHGRTEAGGLRPGHLAVILSKRLKQDYDLSSVVVNVQEIEPFTDLRLEAQNLLTVMVERDPYVTTVGRMVLEDSIRVLDNARNFENDCLKKAEELHNSDMARAGRLGLDPASVPPVEAYMGVKGVTG